MDVRQVICLDNRNPEHNSWVHPNTKSISAATEGEGCPRCGGAVFAAEQMLAKTRSWHKSCFKCKTCLKSLDSTSHCDGPDGDIYCKVHYARLFGPKGVGYGQGAGVLQSDESILNGDQYLANKPHLITDTASILAPEGEGCPRCGGKVYAAEECLSKGRSWHRNCFKCCICKMNLDSINACDADKEVFCRTCYAKKYGPKGYGFACGSGFLLTDVLANDQNDTQRPRYSDTSVIKAAPGEPSCPRCGGAVFAAEQMLARGSVWHKRCYSCGDCRRPLDSILACDGPDRNIYCKACYGKKFAIKGFGYGHSPTLVTVGESTAPLIDVKPGGQLKGNEENSCGRCGFAVFEAEKMLCKAKVWHKRCFNCADCRRSLDSTNLCDSPDGEIYCRACYGRKFGPKGVGFGIGAGALSMA
ncbi:unnamed protein product [Allacma fusca]|uniref:LIM zinc-binding domain-containing protein n=1 Tax=Allacma fusca TaxID=39272 RepID=A0A8J2L268_9HEXA|nr:unnamed protein product [Allacma fusca]